MMHKKPEMLTEEQMKEKVEQTLQKLVDNVEEEQQKLKETINYHIKDFNINELPDENPLMMTINFYTKQRVLYQQIAKKGQTPNFEKPTVKNFLQSVQREMQRQNKQYKKTKIEFENALKEINRKINNEDKEGCNNQPVEKEEVKEDKDSLTKMIVNTQEI